jgi:hypothetical protein
VTFSCAPRGMEPQRLTLTVIFPIARGMMMGICWFAWSKNYW